MDEAQKAGGPAAEKFERIGVSVMDSSGKMKSLNEIMLQIADKFSTWEDGPRKIAIAVDLFGKSGERLVPYLNQGAAGIKKFYEEAERMGIILDESMIKKGTELDEKFKQISASISAMSKKAVVGIYEIVTSTQTWVEAQERLDAAIASAGGLVTEEMSQAIEMQKVNEAAEQGSKIFEKLNAAALKQAVQPPAIVDKEKDLKVYREVNLQLLKDEESTLKRIVDLQDKLNKSSDDAIKIMEQLGVGTKASLTQWINEDIVGEYSKLLGSKLFNPEEMEAAKGKYIEALQGAMSTGGWGGEFRQIEEAINRINTMKIEDTEIQKARNELQDLQKYMAYLDTFTAKIKLDNDQVVTAQNQIEGLRQQLIALTSQRWNVNIDVTGTGSTQAPIMDKIDEIYGGFENMSAYMANMKANVEMSDITAQIGAIEAQLAATKTAPLHTMGAIGSNYQETMWAKSRSDLLAQEAALKNQLRMLAGAQAAYAAPSAVAPSYYAGGGGVGDVSININTMNVNGANAEEIARDLDGKIADMILRNRSKIPAAMSKV